MRHGLALSPDGRLVVFSGLRGNVAQLYVRALDSEAATRIPGTEGAVAPFFSPDGSSVGFWVASTIRKVAVAGGQPATVADVAEGSRGSAAPAFRGCRPRAERPLP